MAAESAQLKKNAAVAAVVLPGGEEVAGGWSISSTIVYIYIYLPTLGHFFWTLSVNVEL